MKPITRLAQYFVVREVMEERGQTEQLEGPNTNLAYYLWSSEMFTLYSAVGSQSDS
jgi:hypothetical protein